MLGGGSYRGRIARTARGGRVPRPVGSNAPDYNYHVIHSPFPESLGYLILGGLIRETCMKCTSIPFS